MNGWFAESLDYAEPVVGARLLKYVREVLEKYRPDVLEIDWMRFGINVSPSREDGCELDYIFKELCELKIVGPK